MKCRFCDKELEYLDVFTLEENRQTVSLHGDGSIFYGVKEPIEASAKYTALECPNCNRELLRMEGDGDDEKIKELLKNE